jgi:hypothetical protein
LGERDVFGAGEGVEPVLSGEGSGVGWIDWCVQVVAAAAVTLWRAMSGVEGGSFGVFEGVAFVNLGNGGYKLVLAGGSWRNSVTIPCQ